MLYFPPRPSFLSKRDFCNVQAVLRNPFLTQGILYDGVYRNLAAMGMFEFVMTFTLVSFLLFARVLPDCAFSYRMCDTSRHVPSTTKRKGNASIPSIPYTSASGITCFHLHHMLFFNKRIQTRLSSTEPQHHICIPQYPTGFVSKSWCTCMRHQFHSFGEKIDAELHSPLGYS